MKRSSKTVSHLRSEPPSDTDSLLAPKTSKPPPQVVKPDPLVFQITLPKVKVFNGWPEEKSSSTRIRAAQTAQGDFAQLSYIGVPTSVAIEQLKRDPTRTAVDYIREALQVRNRLLLLEVVRIYSFSNLVANAGFVTLI